MWNGTDSQTTDQEIGEENSSMKVLWISRHAPHPKQVNELQRIFTDKVEITTYPESIKDLKEIDGLLKSSDIVVSVMPPEMQSRLFARCEQLNVQMLIVHMKREWNEQASRLDYVHRAFRRVTKFDYRTKSL